jgi:hypothetical protein
MNNIHELADDVYDVLFKNIQHELIEFSEAFPDAEVNRELGYIKLNDEYVIKIEKI